jgi:hypothetical protein
MASVCQLLYVTLLQLPLLLLLTIVGILLVQGCCLFLWFDGLKECIQVAI